MTINNCTVPYNRQIISDTNRQTNQSDLVIKHLNIRVFYTIDITVSRDLDLQTEEAEKTAEISEPGHRDRSELENSNCYNCRGSFGARSSHPPGKPGRNSGEHYGLGNSRNSTYRYILRRVRGVTLFNTTHCVLLRSREEFCSGPGP